jgi:MATE family multidrug resistance protein
MLQLALPVVAAELGWMGMGVVDVLMVGRLGAEALGAVSIGRALFIAIAIFGVGVLLGLDTLVARAFGAGRLRDCHVALLHGVYLSLLMAIPSMLLIRALTWPLRGWGVSPAVLELAIPYIEAVSWSALPIFLYAAFRRYLQAMNLVRPVMIALVSANLVNVAFNWILIFGHLGLPALGAPGSGWATLIASCYLALFLAAVILINERSTSSGLFQISWRIELARLRELLALGLPVAVQLLLEVGVFALATALAGRLAPSALAAHQIALTAASVTYMVPLGVSSAAAVRVGQALGREDLAGAGRAGWTALALGGGFMLLPAAAFVLLPEALIRLFTADVRVVAAGVSLLYVAAVFQLFDGIQVVATGALRGAGDTRTPMVWSLAGYWILGLPVGYHLCFHRGWGAAGLWVGFSLGLIVVGCVLSWVWYRRTVRWRRAG